MEEPLIRLVRAAALFHDIAYAARADDPPQPARLIFLADAIAREVAALERLYYSEMSGGASDGA